MNDSPAMSDPDLAHALRAARLKVAFDSHPVSIGLAISLATLTFALSWPSADPFALSTWYVVFLVIAGLRLSLFFAHRKTLASASPTTLEQLQRKLVIACAAGGASWGLASIIAFPDT